MTIEAIKCPGCGSQDVKEVKPDTYFCNQCDSVFKYVDPSNVTTSPAFCSCGNPVTAQCQICQVAMLCPECDIVNISPGMAIWTVGFGYIFRKQIFPTPATGPAWEDRGPLLYFGDLLSTLQTAHGHLRHLCYDCLAGAIPDTAERIATGVICETPRDFEPSAGRCRCCNRSLCEHDLNHPGFRFEIAVVTPDYNSTDPVPITPPRDVCPGCRAEGVDRLKVVCDQDYAGRLEGPQENFSHPVYIVRGAEKQGLTQKRKSALQRAENARAISAAERYASELSAGLEQLVLGNTCECRWPYVILDERATIAAAPAPDGPQ